MRRGSDIFDTLPDIRLRSVLALVAALAATSCSALTGGPDLGGSALAPAPPVALAFQADGKFGAQLGSADRARLSRAELQALDYGRSGQEIGWKGSSDRVTGTIVAYQPFRVGQSSCRRFQHHLKIAEQKQTTDGTACKRNDGAWKLAR